MKLITTIAFACLLTGVVFAENVQWGHSYDDAVAQAKKDKKVVLVDIYTDWCGWCKKLDKEVYTDKDVQQKLTAGFIAVKINPEKGSRNAKVEKQLGSSGYPHIVAVDGDGKKVGELRGFVPAEDFVKFLQQISEKVAAK